MRTRFIAAAFALAVAAAPPAWAQGKATPETLALAKQLIAKITPNRDQTLAAMAGPMVGMMRQMGVTQQDRAQALVDDALMPTMRDHFDAFLAIQAQSYATVLTEDDLKALLTFYDTKAGRDMVAAEPTLAQLRVQGITQWMGQIQPEMQQKIQAMIKAKGWDKP